MYVDTATVRSGYKTYTRHLLRTSYRQNGKVKHKTLANLSGCSVGEIAALKLALKHKGNLAALTSLDAVTITLGKRFGAVWALKEIAQRLGLDQALGTDRQGRLALVQVMVRAIDQGSRLSAVRFAMRHAVCEVLGIDKLDEDDLYENLAWLAEHQDAIEHKLFTLRFAGATPTLFLYDVTSAYLEGTCNALGNWGYNRDKKRGKMQIVVGLLVGPDGVPVAIRVFEGNTHDTQTVSEQIRMLSERFGVRSVTLVGDRGMLKGPQIAALPQDFRYITAITKPQIRKLLADNVLQMELFSEQVCEVVVDGLRYVLRRNPLRAQQMAMTRERKGCVVRQCAEQYTRYLAAHPRAQADKARAKVEAKIKKLGVDTWLTANEHHRVITIDTDKAMLSQTALLDGCYVVQSDVPPEVADAQTLHDRYCDLEVVERIFRTMKTTHLELRPVFVHTEPSTRGHAFVVMLSLLLQRELERCWAALDITALEGIDQLAAIQMQQVELGSAKVLHIPTPDPIGQQLLAAADIRLPHVLPFATASVHTKKKLQSERKRP